MPPKTQHKTQSQRGSDAEENEVILSDYDRLEGILVRVTKAMSDTFISCVEKLVSSLESKLSLRLDVATGELFTTNQHLDRLEKKHTELQKENDNLKDHVRSMSARIESLDAALEELEQHTRNENLLLHGVPVPNDGSKETDLTSTVIDILNRNMPDLALHVEHISVAHRLQSRSNLSSTMAGGAPKPPAIVIRLARRSVKARIIGSRHTLKGKGI